MSFFPTRILVATDGSEEAELAATAAAELAKGTNSELHIVHVCSSEPDTLWKQSLVIVGGYIRPVHTTR
jgi:nucleotide-binding universal stress UspA family protein